MKVKLNETKTFYPIMEKWWKEREFVVVSPSILPQRTFVVYDDSDIPIYSVCLYETDSFLVWLGWPIGNPAIAKNKREGYLKFLFDEVERWAKEAGYHILFTTTDTPPIRKVLEECDYKLGDVGVDHYLKALV